MRVLASLKGGTIFPGSSKNRATTWRKKKSKRTCIHVDSLALIQFSRIKLGNIKKINQNMVNNLIVHTYIGMSKCIRNGAIIC